MEEEIYKDRERKRDRQRQKSVRLKRETDRK